MCVQKCKCVQIRDNVLFWWRQTGISSVCFGADSEQTMSAHKRVAFNLKRILIRLRWIWANDCYTIWSTKYTLRTARTSTRASLFSRYGILLFSIIVITGETGSAFSDFCIYFKRVPCLRSTWFTLGQSFGVFTSAKVHSHSHRQKVTFLHTHIPTYRIHSMHRIYYVHITVIKRRKKKPI